MRATRPIVADAASDSEHHGYHSAVEIDEEVGSWRDWVGPAAAIFFLIAGLVGLTLTINGSL
jgi:hypothetical protein